MSDSTHTPHLCISPACGKDCSDCNRAISPNVMRDNAIRFSLLNLQMDPRFGMPMEWLQFPTLADAVDSEIEKRRAALKGGA
jgi:hypothetical protein